MEKADDDKLIRYTLTCLIVGLMLLIFSGLRNIFSYVIFGLMVFMFLKELFKAMVAGIDVN